uniref:BTB domain-containing protein n=1 Tax=Anopheles atroparvus TaxID=41427 RepID=A0AAG5CND0_ANOAO
MADDEQFSLCWNNFNTNLSAGFHESLLRGDLVDVTLAAEGHLVKAHRLILSVCSPYFRKMFTQVPVNQHAFIFLKDVSHSALKDLIQFMYCGEVNVKQDALPAFISTAEALQIKGLTETGDSAPVQQSPAKEVITAASTAISAPAATSASPRTKVQRTRVQSYKLDSEESGDDKVQIQPVSHHVASQQVQQQTGSQKRSLQQRTVGPSQASKRTKLSVTAVEALEAPEATQVQTVQIVKQVLDPEYVDLPIVETINTKAEPEYAEETGEIETVETEAEQEQALTEHEQSADQEHGDDDGNYVEDETYGEMSKFEESYFTEGEDGKPGASGFGDSYTSDGGTGTEQSAQENQSLPAAPALMELPFVPGVRPWHVGEPVKHSIQHSPNGCFGFISSCGIHFPIDSEEMVEVLESMVREYDGARDEYVAFLRTQMTSRSTLLSIFGNIFADSAMYGYNFSGFCNRGPKRKAMHEYDIFNGCMTDAWSEYGINSTNLREHLTTVIKYINGRKRNRKYFQNRRAHRQMSAENGDSTGCEGCSQKITHNYV